jgi:quercetin dioxygenase-like cupin family protein
MNRSWKSLLLIAIAVVAVSCAPPAAEEPQAAAEPAPAAEAAPAAEPQDATVVDADHYTVELENDHFRVVRIAYGPGEGSVMHSHPAHVAVFLTDLDTEFQAPDGATEAVHAEAGSHLFIPAGSHQPSNIGADPFEGVAIEIKPAATDGEAAAGEHGADPAEVDAEHYTVEFENDQVRVLRISYQPGSESTMHYHSEHAAVALTDQNWELTLPDGTVQEVNLKAGEAILAAAGDHQPRNAGDEAAEVVVVERK